MFYAVAVWLPSYLIEAKGWTLTEAALGGAAVVAANIAGNVISAALMHRGVPRWKLLLTYDGEVNRYKSTHPRTEKRPQLFDLLADPAETKNLAGDNPEIVARLADRIGKWYPVKKRKVLTKFE